MSTLRVEGIRNAAASSDAITLAVNSSASANLSNYGRKNWIVNGGFEVHQRGDLTHSYSWCGDRFQNRTGSSTVIAQSSTVPAGFNKSMSLTASSGTLAFAWNTVLEAGNNLSGTAIGGFYANNTKWTVSIWSTQAPKVRVDFTDGYGPTNPVAIVAYTNMTSTGETSNGFTRYKHTFDIGSNNPVGTSKGLHIGWSLISAASDVKFTGAQLEKGEYCGPYEHLSYDDYLRKCQRYYYKMPNDSGDTWGQYWGNGFCDDTTNLRGVITFPQPMRIKPTFESTGTATDYYVWHPGNTSTVCSAAPTMASSDLSNLGGRLKFTVASGLTQGRGGVFRSNSNSAFLAWSAEIG